MSVACNTGTSNIVADQMASSISILGFIWKLYRYRKSWAL